MGLAEPKRYVYVFVVLFERNITLNFPYREDQPLSVPISSSSWVAELTILL